jgi:hypothetical protein
MPRSFRIEQTFAAAIEPGEDLKTNLDARAPGFAAETVAAELTGDLWKVGVPCRHAGGSRGSFGKPARGLRFPTIGDEFRGDESHRRRRVRSSRSLWRSGA